MMGSVASPAEDLDVAAAFVPQPGVGAVVDGEQTTVSAAVLAAAVRLQDPDATA
jgi:hypothetical protein